MSVTQGNVTVSLIAPLTGVLIPIEQCPDPVFAKKMVGEGVSLDPISNVLVAPCDGEVTLVHASKHAVTLRHESGLELLLHIGLDTVGMDGEGLIQREPFVQRPVRRPLRDRLTMAYTKNPTWVDGEGFTPKVQLGTNVKAGDPLIEFDLDLVARKAKSVMTQMVITNSDHLTSFAPRVGFVTAGKDVASGPPRCWRTSPSSTRAPSGSSAASSRPT